ncbi:MAG: hypothetical protein JXO72_15115 [Vicinamibacteria bacterium]|nr:hypothetical protein [Vicinamibacteria bacterium]
METLLTTVVRDKAIDLDGFMEVWPLLSSKDLLQALESCSGKTVSLFLCESQDARAEMLLDVVSARVGVDFGEGVRWGRWREAEGGVQIKLEDGVEYTLSGLDVGAILSG